MADDNKNIIEGGENEDMDTETERRKVRGERIRRLRQRRGITQVQLGRMIGLKSPSATMSLLERGKQGMSMEQMELIAKSLGVQPVVIAMGKAFPEETEDLVNNFLNMLNNPNEKAKREVISTILNSKK